MKMIPLFKPYMPAALPEIDNILHSGALSYGKWGKLFEAKLADFIGNDKIITVNSFNSAMLVALTVMDTQPGDEIIASPMSCLASNQPFATEHLKVVWADIDPTTGTLDPESVQSKITSKTKAIFHNHFCGYPGDIDAINAIGKNNGIIVVDDAIEAFGSEYKGNIIGNVGADITVFSFQTVRLPNTIDGGAIAFKNAEHFEKAKRIRDYGIDRTNFRDANGEINPLSNITQPGFGATLSEINSYIGLQQMNEVALLIKKQRENAIGWTGWLDNNFPLYKVLNQGNEKLPNFWIYGILVGNKSVATKKFRDMGYYSSGVHLPNNYYSVFGKQGTLPGVDEFYSKFVSLPSGWWFELNNNYGDKKNYT